ncbi:MAG TPA: beta-galactosidase, partial [Candidatus Eisenbacteria bacterium]|nr:beta-galactosidase [Candidatus Eisenbacteria bacterium]
MTNDEYQKNTDCGIGMKKDDDFSFFGFRASFVIRHSSFVIRLWLFIIGICALVGSPAARAGAGALEITNGYFWDPITTNYFIPRGIAYQTWNPPVGANQSFAQLDYDFLEFKKMHATSVRCEMVWGEIEIAEGKYDWSKPDHLVDQAEKLGLKLFILIGFQYPPAWFPKAWRGINDRILDSNVESNYLSDVLNYEHPDARRIYSNHIYAVTERYKTNRAIGGWILGNEYAYFDLWEPPELFPNHRILGYDPISQASFRAYLASLYQNNIAALNTHWRTNYANFDAVMMPGKYPSDRNVPGYHDLIQWRKKSIGDFVALGALAAKAADPNHLKTYSMVGGIFSPVDANITCEDAKTIVARCRAAGAPLDFWSINNYAWAAIGDDLRTGDFGIGKLQAASGLPVMISETGHSSTETNFGEGAGARQAKALPGQMWEALMSGAIGTHLFHWSDRDRYTQGYFEREKGFGIVDQKRQIKVPVYENVSAMFRRMADVRIENLLGGSTNPPADVQFFWSINAEMGWSRANSDAAQLWGALKRLGYQPGIIDDEQFERGDYTNAPALVLSRCYQMDPRHLDRITNVVSAGIHVHANADLPGQFNAYHQTNTNWAALMSYLFGLNVASAVPGWDSGATNILALHQQLNFKGVKTLGTLANGFIDQIYTWKIWHGITANSGTTIVTHTGASGTQPAMPALHTKTLATAKTAINTFALGDIFVLPREYKWDFRYKWLQAIYRYHFGLTPLIELTGPGASDVVPDYRICRNGSVLVSLLNEDTNSTSVTLTATNLLKGKTVEILTPKSTSELIAGGILEVNSDGVLTLNLSGDDYVLLYAYPSGGRDQSLINPDPHKIWFESAPVAVWPNNTGYGVNVGFDTRGDNLTLHVSFESEHSSNKIYGQSAGFGVTGKSNSELQVPIPDADLNDPDYVSTPDGGNYVWHAWLEQGGVKVSETFLPVRLLWGVRPITLPVNITAGQSYSIPV